MAERYIYIKGIGDVLLKKNMRAKRLGIKVVPMQGVIVNIPRSVSYDRASRFVLEKESWIKKTLKKTASIEQQFTVFDHETNFRTKDHLLRLYPIKTNEFRYQLKAGQVIFTYPDFLPVYDEQVQSAIRHAVLETWRIEAKRYVPERVAHLAKRYGFDYRDIRIKNTKTRWGSCSNLNNLNFSLHIMRLPQTLQDYLILHELCHTVEKNHSKAFWDLLDKVCLGQARVLDKTLNTYRLDIF